MTRSPTSSSRGGPADGRPRRTARRPSLYTTVLSLAIAAIAATWLPFSVLYINALSQRPATVPALTARAAPSHAAAVHSAAPTPVTTRVS